MSLEQFRESIGVIQFGLESVDGTKPDCIITIRFMDVLLGVALAVGVWML